MKRDGIRTMAVWGLLFIGVFFGFALLGISSTGPAGAMGSIAFTWASLPLAGLTYGKKIFNWKGIDTYKTDEEKKNAIVERADEFVKELLVHPVTGQKMTGADSNLMGDSPISLVMSDTIKTPDRGYELIFEENDMRQATSDSFDIVDVTGGVTFYQQLPGEEAKLSKIGKAAKTAVSMLRFTGGLNISDDWIRFNKYYLIDRLFSETIKRWFTNRATIFYGLITALGAGINESFATDDITTINNACAKILEDLEAAGYDVDETTQFIIACNPKLKARISKALASTWQTQGINNQVVFNFTAVVMTTKLANTSYYVCVPGIKAQRGEWEDLTQRPAQRDERLLGAAHIWTGAYNGIIAESKQFRRCALS